MLKRIFLWDYRRASWQYDVIVAVILAFIFLTPREWFRDQPRVPTASGMALLPSENGSSVFWVNSELLAGVSEHQRAAQLTQVLRGQMKNQNLIVTRVQAVRDSEGELQGYMAFARP